jgi:hypothetical protein
VVIVVDSGTYTERVVRKLLTSSNTCFQAAYASGSYRTMLPHDTSTSASESHAQVTADFLEQDKQISEPRELQKPNISLLIAITFQSTCTAVHSDLNDVSPYTGRRFGKRRGEPSIVLLASV